MSKVETHGIVLFDEHGREIDPEHTRLGFTGDVFLSWGLDDMPPQGAEFEVTIRAKIGGGVSLKEIGEDPKVWVAIAKGKVDSASGFRVLETPAKQGPLDEAARDAAERFVDRIPQGTTVTVEGGGHTATVEGRGRRS